MSALAIDMAGGFNDEDRRRFERIDLRVEDILKRLEDIAARFHEVEVDIDDLRGSKADKDDLSSATVRDHETRMRLAEVSMADIKQGLADIKKDLEPLKAWRWKELGAIGAIVALAEFLFHVVLKG